MPAVNPSKAPPTRSLAYLVSQYPMLSMIFIIREVVQLREMGFHIDVASINPPDRKREGLTAVEFQESSQTYYLKEHGLAWRAGRGLLQTLLTNPAGYFPGGLRFSFDPDIGRRGPEETHLKLRILH